MADVQQNGREAVRSSYAAVLAAEVAEQLDWNAFSARHFHGRRRHDLEALSAYAAYRRGREWRPPPRLRLVQTDPVPAADDAGSKLAGATPLLVAVAAVQVNPTQA